MPGTIAGLKRKKQRKEAGGLKYGLSSQEFPVLSEKQSPHNDKSITACM